MDVIYVHFSQQSENRLVSWKLMNIFASKILATTTAVNYTRKFFYDMDHKDFYERNTKRGLVR